jgi:hypothetical protein
MLDVTLDRDDLITLIKGITPSYEQMEIPAVKDNGVFSGSYGTWKGNYSAFGDEFHYNEEYLWDLYKELKNNWLTTQIPYRILQINRGSVWYGILFRGVYEYSSICNNWVNTDTFRTYDTNQDFG